MLTLILLEMLDKVDVHAHYLPADYRQALLDHGHAQPDGFPVLPTWSPEEHLAMMDRVGIRTAMLSVSSPGVTLEATRSTGRAGSTRRARERCASTEALRAARHAAPAGRRRVVRRDPARLRHAAGRRRRRAHERRDIYLGDPCLTRPSPSSQAQGGHVHPPTSPGMLREDRARPSAAGPRVPVRHDAGGREHGPQRDAREAPRYSGHRAARRARPSPCLPTG